MIEVARTPQLDYRYAVGKLGTQFLQGLRDGKILAGRCDGCGLVLVPPRVVCAGCYKPMHEVIEVGPRGTVMAYTVVTFPFLDPFTGEPRPLPYAYGMIRFEGADNTLQYEWIVTIKGGLDAVFRRCLGLEIRTPFPRLGEPMRFDHRRILATAIARLRAKLKYRPVVFELMPPEFTLTALQRTVEAISGRRLHKQNFRRLVEGTALVEPTGETSTATGGRPAALFRFRREVMSERPAPGLRLGIHS